MNGLSLFSGGGIGELAFKHIIPNYRTVGYVDNDKYCCKIIEARIKDGILDDAPIWQVDIREFNRKIAPIYKEKVDWLSGGFPCQPFSVAGRQLGEADERNMWPATIEAIRVIRPRYAFLENVPALLAHKYIRRIFGDLAEIGYDCEWDVISAAFVGAPHLRRRLWILAYPKGIYGTVYEYGKNSKSIEQEFWSNKSRRSNSKKIDREGDEPNWIVSESKLGRVVDGMAYGVDRLETIGNGWVPQVVERILQVEEQ